VSCWTQSPAWARPGRSRLLLAAALLVVPLGCGRDGEEDETALPVDGAVSSDTPEATLAGLEILAQGGNAVDAAVAVSLVLGVTQPSESGLGGSAVMMVVAAGAEPVLIHPPGQGSAGAAPSGSASPPAYLRVLHHAWTRYGSGRLTWEALVQPAIRAATDGYSLGRFTHRTIVREYDRIVVDTAASQLLLSPDRSIPPESSARTNPDLAAVLASIAVGGADAFYGGELGQRVVEAISRTGAQLGGAELAATPAPRESPALRGSYRGHSIWTAPEPYGGPDVLDAMRFLELVPPAWIATPGWVRTGWFAEALAFAWTGGGAHPVEHLATLPQMPAPANSDLPVAASGAGGEGEAAGSGAPSDGRGGPGQGGRTSHFSVVDGYGNAVSVTQTLGVPFGSGLLPGLGFFYQDPEAATAAAPFVPTIVSRDGRVELVLGSPGAERGVSAVVQVLVRTLGLDEPLQDAVHAPRLHLSIASPEARGRLFLEGVHWDDTLSVRDAGYARWGEGADARALERGFLIGEWDLGAAVEGVDPWFGGVNAVGRTGTAWNAVGDPRRDGAGGVVTAGAPTVNRAPAASTAPPPESGSPGATPGPLEPRPDADSGSAPPSQPPPAPPDTLTTPR
jgi:gamma-glutamyltranspeptidase/glutathione hydrolase